MKVLLNFHLGRDVRIPVPDGVLALLRSRFPAVEFVGADDAATLAREAADAEVFFGWHFPPALLPAASRLRWMQAASAGVEGNVADVLERGIILTNAAGVAATTIAEHVLGVMLALCRNHHVALRLQAERRWDRLAVMAGGGSPIRAFAGSRVAVLGLGPIGLAVGAGSVGLGAVAHGFRRRKNGDALPPFEAVYAADQLDELLPWADFVVVALPLTRETEGLLGARELGLLEPTAYLVNVARGGVVDEDALVGALRTNAIAGAALDVFRIEPLPSDHPLWTLPNVILTPHVAGARPDYLERAVELFVDNLERYVAGTGLRNVVDPKLGYPRKR